jgi:hypothetical protein
MSLQELESEVSISDINELPSIKHGWRILNFHAIPNQISIDLWDFPATGGEIRNRPMALPSVPLPQVASEEFSMSSLYSALTQGLQEAV